MEHFFSSRGPDPLCYIGAVADIADMLPIVLVDEEEWDAYMQPQCTVGLNKKKKKKRKKKYIYNKNNLLQHETADDGFGSRVSLCVRVYMCTCAQGQLCITPPPPHLSLYPLRWP